MTAQTKQKPGCLSLFFPSLGNKPTKTEVSASSSKSSDEPIRSSEALPEVLPYRVRDDFLSPAEFSFYKILSSLGGTRLTIQSKVRLADVFFVARPNENAAYFNRIVQKHLDFLVCDSVTMKPLLGIELDDASHGRDNRQERDEFFDRVFKAAGLPLLRMPVKREYNTREVAEQIAPLLKDKLSISTATSQSDSNESIGSVPLCHKCGIPMVVRTVAKGDHKGKQFYGFQNYPRCHEMKHIPV